MTTIAEKVRQRVDGELTYATAIAAIAAWPTKFRAAIQDGIQVITYHDGSYMAFGPGWACVLRGEVRHG